MSILLDTNVFLWAAGLEGKLSESAKTLLDDPAQELFFSSASSWEIAIKWSQGRLTLPASPYEVVNRIITTSGLSHLAINIKDACSVAELPNHHSDPFDRLLVAQARSNNLRLMTANQTLERYDVDVIALWLDDDDE
jgi:PIN domain nuclease of toxin-antitoxin system